MNEYEQLPNRPSRTDRDVADRLDRLSPDRADRVLRRAIQLQSDSDFADAVFDIDTLNRVAAELGVHRDMVAKALAEELSQPLETPAGSWWERVFGPRRVTDQTLVNMSREDLDRCLAQWMTKHEGLHITTTDGDVTVWTKRPSPVNSIRHGLKIAQGTGALRSVRVAHRVESVSEDQQLVTLQANTTPAVWTGVGISGAGVLVALGLGLGLGLGVGAITGLGVGLAALLVQGAIGVVTARSWIHQVRHGIERALTGIAHPELTTQETVGDAVVEILGHFRRRR